MWMTEHSLFIEYPPPQQITQADILSVPDSKPEVRTSIQATFQKRN